MRSLIHRFELARWLALALATAVAGCSSPGSAGGTPASSAAEADAIAAETGMPARLHADAGGIAWIRGNIDAAFSTARSTHRPVLLYWGAQWCPPCQQLKATVFSRPDFIAKTRLFVPVYLDGDDPGAQKWGEQFNVQGYPTVLVLDADRREVLRIAGGMDLTQYASVLDNALADLQPVDELLRKSATTPLDDNECHRLAYNSWELDYIDVRQYPQRAAALEQAAAHCPAAATSDRGRLLLVAADYRAGATKGASKPGGRVDPLLAARIRDIGAMLDDPRQVAANGDLLLYLDDNLFGAVKRLGPAAPRDFAVKYSNAMDDISGNQNLAEADRLSALGSKMRAAKLLSEDGKLPAALAKDGRDALDAVLKERQTPYVRSGIINSALPIFELLGEQEQAYALVQGELATAEAPYYFKADLADLAEQLGRRQEAVKWLAEAYDESRGPATRFQWGAIYVSGLIRLDPDDGARIQSVGEQVLGELAGPDRIYRRARLRLASLGDELEKWNAHAKGAHAAVIKALHARMQTICVGIPAADDARRSCDSFLAG